MSVLRTVVLSALAGSVMHVSLRLARSSPGARKGAPDRNRPPEYIDASDVLALVAATKKALRTLPAASSVDPSWAREVEKIETLGIVNTALLMERELDERLKVLELALAHQTNSLRSLSELTAHTESAVSCLARAVESLCEKVTSQAPAVAPAPAKALIPFEPPAAATAMPAAVIEETDLEPVRNERFVERLTCPTCRSRQTRPAHRFTLLDDCLRLFAFNPWRCRGCGARFYHIVWGITGKPLEPVARFWEAALGRFARLVRPGKAPQPENLA